LANVVSGKKTPPKIIVYYFLVPYCKLTAAFWLIQFCGIGFAVDDFVLE